MIYCDVCFLAASHSLLPFGSYEIVCLIPLLRLEMLFFNTLKPATSTLLTVNPFFFLGDCRRSYEDDDPLHTRDDVFFLSSSFLLFIFSLSSSFL